MLKMTQLELYDIITEDELEDSKNMQKLFALCDNGKLPEVRF